MIGYSSNVGENGSAHKSVKNVSPRDGDIICKAVSAILLLLLKWFRVLRKSSSCP